VTSIGELAFYYCKELSSVVIPNSVTSMGEKAFFYCSKINSLTISNSITELPEFAFEGCSSLISVTIPESINKIGARAFSNCSSLQSVVIPNSVTVIGESAFDGCKSLTSIKIPENAFLNSYAFRSCSNLTSVTIPNGVSFIGFSVFDYCSKLKTITIGKGIKKIQGEAFAYCDELTDVYCYSSEVPDTWSNVFTESYPEYATLHVPSSSLEAYSDKSPWKDFGSKVKLPEVIYMVDNELYSKDLFFIGEHITPIEEPEKEGHTFSGWSDIPETMPNEDVTITGSFTVNSYTLTYLVDGEVYKTCEVKYGTVISPEDYPTKIGYSFSGWENLPSTMPAHDVTVTGSFIANGTTSKVKLSKTKAIIEKGKTLTLKAKVYPTTEDQSVTWESSDPTIAKVSSSGKVKGKKVGTATITCTSKTTGTKATCKVTVGYVKLSNTEVCIEKGKALTLVAKVYPTTLEQSVTWKSSNTAIATVTSKGKVKGLRTGTTIITCTSNTTGLSAICVVTVGYVKLNYTELTVEKGKTKTLKSKVYPTTENQSVTWKSSDPTIVKVASTGKIKGLKAGTATIICISNATGLSTTCKVTVVEAATAPSMDGTDDEVTGIEEKSALAEEFDVYDLNGRKVLNKVTSLDGLSAGVYIVNGKKVLRQ
jgi:uncharacterized protein YjdB